MHFDRKQKQIFQTCQRQKPGHLNQLEKPGHLNQLEKPGHLNQFEKPGYLNQRISKCVRCFVSKSILWASGTGFFEFVSMQLANEEIQKEY